MDNRGESSTKALQEFKDKISKEAEALLQNTFPKKVLELNELLQTPRFKQDPSHLLAELNIPVPSPAHRHCQGDGTEQAEKKRKIELMVNHVGGTPVYVLPNGVAPCNKNILEIIDIVKPLIKELVEQTNLLKMWILFLIPKIEDGNNFGVSVQEETLAEVQRAESEAATYLDQMTRYFLTRAKIVSKVAKYPHVEDYRRSITEMDEKEYLSLQLTVAELRNYYSSLLDLISKNMDKIKKPRTANAMSLF